MSRAPKVTKPVSLRDPVKVRAGSIGARRRWGIPHSVTLRGLTEAQREFVIETVRELRTAAERVA